MEKILTKKFNRLKEFEGSYLITHKKKFHPLFDVNEYVKDSVIWAGNGERFKKSNRNRKEIIIDCIQGKIGEFALYKYLRSIGYDINPPSLEIIERGSWDDGDLFLGDKKIQIKTSPYFSNLLLLKKNDWDLDGNYRFNINENSTPYKAFFLCRIKPSVQDVLGDFEILNTSKTIETLSNVNFRADIPGFASLKDFREIISSGQYIKAGFKIGNRTISEDQYYFQSGDLRDIDEIPSKK